MWNLFMIDVLFFIFIMFVPGYLFCRALKCNRVLSLAFAPVCFALGSYLLAFLCLKMGVACSWILISVPLCLISLLSYGLRVFLDKNSLTLSGIHWRTFAVLCLYVAFAAVVVGLVFVKSLDGAGSFAQQYDNYAHLSSIRDFLDSGAYALADPLSYPASWYNLVALVANFGGNELCVAVNAVDFVLMACVFPAGIFCFISFIFKKRFGLLISGCVCTLAFSVFPWGFIIFGPLYPNLLAYSALPAVMCALILGLKNFSVRELVLFVAGCIALVLMHPNAIFAGIVLMAPYIVAWIWHLDTYGLKSEIWQKRNIRIAIVALFVLFVIVVWTILNASTVFKSVVSFNWPAYLPKVQALANVFVLNLTPNSIPQYCLAGLVIVGIVRCLWEKANRWLIVSFMLSICILLVAQTTDGMLKHYLAGFWYTDRYRIAAMAALAGISLASLGLYALIRSSVLMLKQYNADHRKVMICSGALIAVVAVALYFPSYNESQDQVEATPFSNVANKIEEKNSLSEQAVYSQSEVDFVNEAMSIIPDDALVANIPFDGSFLSYGVNGINTAYRALETDGYWDGKSDPEGELIRANLCNYTNDLSTFEAVKNSGIQYVLLLDNDDTTWERMFQCAKEPAYWKGISGITDNTPGFEVVLSQDDMRLYRLTAI